MVEWKRNEYKQNWIEHQAAVGSFLLLVVEYGSNFSGKVVNGDESVCVVPDMKHNLEEAKAALIELAKEEFRKALAVLGE